MSVNWSFSSLFGSKYSALNNDYIGTLLFSSEAPNAGDNGSFSGTVDSEFVAHTLRSMLSLFEFKPFQLFVIFNYSLRSAKKKYLVKKKSTRTIIYLEAIFAVEQSAPIVAI